VRLHEIGPRLELEVVKVEEGLCTGQVGSGREFAELMDHVCHVQNMMPCSGGVHREGWSTCIVLAKGVLWQS
jgi:hypothetical protein